MSSVFLFLIITFPLLELYILIKIGGLIGAIPTIALVVFSAVLGTLLLRRHGLLALHRARAAATRGELPAADLLDGLIVLIGALLLLIPGVLSDIAGLLCLLPGVRRRLLQRALRDTTSASRERPSRPGPHLIEGEYWEERIKD